MKQLAVLAATTVLFLMIGTLVAQEKKAESKEKEQTVKGEVVDVACYLKHGASGEDHKACAEACAKGGGALGILSDDGKLYISLLPDNHKNNPNAILMDHIAHKVEATGMVRSKHGVNGIMITKVEMAKMPKEEKKD